MKNLKKFENWIDDETADTNRRMELLDQKEKYADDDFEEASPEEEELVDRIHDLLVEYRGKLAPEQISLILRDYANQPEIWS